MRRALESDQDNERDNKKIKTQHPSPSPHTTDDTKPKDYFDLYSRQFYVIGEKAMNTLGRTSVFISGMGGLGVEIAKNIILAGVRRVTIHDRANTQWTHLSTQFYLSPKSIGKNRAEESVSSLSKLNPYVKLDVSTVDLSQDIEFLKQYQCVVLTEVGLPLQIRINKFCHENHIKYISSDVFGVFGQAFVDFNEHSIFDHNGEAEREIYVSHISQGPQAEIWTLEEGPHGLQENDVVKLVDVKGMVELNSIGGSEKLWKVVEVISPSKFKIDADSSYFGEYRGGGIVLETKQTSSMSFKSLEESLKDPEILIADFAKLSVPNELHVAFRALHQFVGENSELPRPWHVLDAQKLIAIAKPISPSQPLNFKLLRYLSFTCRGSIVPFTSVFGGHVAQEVLKVTGKFTPLKQWFYMDAQEILDHLLNQPALKEENLEDKYNFEDFLPVGSRYDGQIICIGKKFTQRLQDSRVFMIGAGAIGCEMMKNYAMLGISSGVNGKIDLSDNDLIEKSNLNRQFLFREDDIRKPKSDTAAKAVLAMNPELHISPFFEKVCSETEYIFSDSFFSEHQVIVNALDNIPSRIYIDKRCVANEISLLESGTMGTKGHVQVILPRRTENYAASRDPTDKEYPFCTIKSFPARIEHTIEWAREKFQTVFVVKPREVEKFLEHPGEYLNSVRGQSGPKMDVLKYILKFLRSPIRRFEDCLKVARIKFDGFFKNGILQLLEAFPLDHKIQDGTDFWKSPKKPPQELYFSVDNEHHFEFVWAMANLTAFVYNVKWSAQEWTKERIKEVLRGVEPEIPTFKKKDKVFITDEKVTVEDLKQKSQDGDQYAELINQLTTMASGALPKHSFNIEEFEKDDDKNFHVDFIAATANLRAENYQIARADRMEIKRIAGRIIPAIATTTTAVAGLAALELMKVLLPGEQPALEVFKNTFLNLALPLYAISEPGPAARTRIAGEVYCTVWDKWEYRQREATLKEFMGYLEEKHKLSVSGVFHGAKTVYLSMMPTHIRRLGQKVISLVDPSVIQNAPFIDLVVTVATDDGGNVQVPTVRFFLK